MITFIRTSAIASGKGEEAVAFAHQVAKLVADKTAVKSSVSMPFGGNPWRIRWLSSHDNMAQLDSVTETLMADADYRKLLESAAPYFLPGTTHDELWMSI